MALLPPEMLTLPSAATVSATPPAPNDCIELRGTSPAAHQLRTLVDRAAAGGHSVLLLAERGLETTGLACAIHLRSQRRAEPFLVLDCAGGTAADVERALFGRAEPRTAGLEVVAPQSLVGRAGRGTLLLDNAADLSASTQARLARALRDGEVRLSGASGRRELGARLIAAAPPSLTTDVEEGRFREDLYRRLGALQIEVPALRHRREDIGDMALFAAGEIASRLSRPIRFTQMALTLLAACPWRGNTEELGRFLERVLTGAEHDTIRLEDLLAQVRLDGGPAPIVPNGPLREARRHFERDYIAAVLQQHGGRIPEAAQVLGIQRTNLYRKARQLGIRCGALREPHR